MKTDHICGKCNYRNSVTLEDFASFLWEPKPQGLKLECSICSSECDDRFVGATFKGEDLPIFEACYRKGIEVRREVT